MACPHKPTCPLFPMFSSQNALNVWKIYYCDGDHLRCARFQASSSSQPVPLTLLPNGTHLKAK